MATTSIWSAWRTNKRIAPTEETKERVAVHNPYLAARKEWDERYGDLISRARNWRMAFFLAAAIAFLAVGGMIVIAKQARVVPYVVAIDSLGRTVASGPAEQTTAALNSGASLSAGSDASTSRRSTTDTCALAALPSCRRFRIASA